MHLGSNLLGHSPNKVRAEDAAVTKLAFKTVISMEADLENTLAMVMLPKSLQRRIRVTNVQEHLIEQMLQHKWVIRIVTPADRLLC